MRAHQLKTYLFLISILFFSACGQFFGTKGQPGKYAPFQKHRDKTIDEQIENMTLDEKIGQLLFVKAELEDTSYLKLLQKYIQEFKVGGLMFSEVHPKYHGAWMDSLQQFSSIPLLNGVLPNTEIGDVLSNSNLGLHAIRSDSLVQVAVQNRLNEYRRLGIDLNFETNLSTITGIDKIIDDSVFTIEQMNILARNNLLINAYQQKGIMVGLDGFNDFYLSNDDQQIETDSILMPHYNLVTAGLSAILIDDKILKPNHPVFGQVNGVYQYFRDSLEFGGLTIYNGFDDNFENWVKGGVDAFILSSTDLKKAKNTIQNQLKKGKITEGMLNFRVRKILQAKSWTNKFESRVDTLPPLEIATAPFNHALLEAATVVLGDNFNKIPIQEFQYSSIELTRQLKVSAIKDKVAELARHVVESKTNCIEIKNLDEQQIIKLIKEIERQVDKKYWKQFVIYYQAHPNYLKHLKAFSCIIYNPYQNDWGLWTHHRIASGENSAQGQLMMSVSDKWLYGTGKKINQVKLGNYQNYPEVVGISNDSLRKIEQIVQEGIQNQAMPGCQVLVAKNGKIIYHKSFGYHTYSKKTKVEDNHLYDLASITKVAATTMAMMKLYQQGKYSLSDSLYQIFGKDTLSNIDKITIKELLIHQSGLQANMPILRYYHNKKKEKFYARSNAGGSKAKIANNFYVFDRWIDTLWKEMKALEIGEKQYKYSDVNANLLQWIVEKITEKQLDEYVNSYYYQPLGMNRTLYNPLEKYGKWEVVPTEKDTYWRKQLVHGYVHDESAALQGGMAGNAGLFSNANDLAILGQMLLNGGNYGGRQFLQYQTIDLFTASTHGNHRGLGFNKQTEDGAPGCARQAPLSTYGHTGFTGNCMWIDPENDLIYVFLSNRVYPKRNGRLSQMQIRERIHEVVYRAMGLGEEYE